MEETAKKTLVLVIQPTVIQHLGIKMYQKAVDVIAELVANAWDADAETVNIDIDVTNRRISVSDTGCGMTHEGCQKSFLQVGRDRRKVQKTDKTPKGRPVLGRKGIGKFAGFGIAKKIAVDTTSEETGEQTVFELDIELLENGAAGDDMAPRPVTVTKWRPDAGKEKHGTIIVLQDVKVELDPDRIGTFSKELSRRFLLSSAVGFSITVNSQPLPDCFMEEKEFLFPKDFTDDERLRFDVESVDKDAWGLTKINDFPVRWRVGLQEHTIKDEELRGIAIFARGKLAQRPFFFDHTGGASGQHAFEYMTGQVVMDFIDEGSMDLIATERQRINLQLPEAKPIKEWGIRLVKEIGAIWKARRSEKRMKDLDDKLVDFSKRLSCLPSHERKVVRSVMEKMASFERLGQARFHDWCNQILTAWEGGRLKELISQLAAADDLDETKFVELLTEADVLTSLQIAESIKTKLFALNELKQKIKGGEGENQIRDFIYQRPWIIHPKWEQFKKESYLDTILAAAGAKELRDEVFHGRVDMVLGAGNTLLLIEFMKPGLKLDGDHVTRLQRYVFDIRTQLAKSSGTRRHVDEAYVIAEVTPDEYICEQIKEIETTKRIYFKTWDILLADSLAEYREHLALLKSRNPDDPRIQVL